LLILIVVAFVFQFVLPPYHFAVFTVNLIAPNTEGHRSAQVMIFWKFDILPQKESKELVGIIYKLILETCYILAVWQIIVIVIKTNLICNQNHVIS